jgi:hypothetical protein
MGEAKLWVYSDKGQTHLGSGQKDVQRERTGRYRIVFSKDFIGKYAAVASATDAYAQIESNTPSSVTVLCYDHTGQPVDAEIFVILFGNQ